MIMCDFVCVKICRQMFFLHTFGLSVYAYVAVSSI